MTNPDTTIEALVAEFSRDRGITLVVDQCFALIDPFRVGISLLPNVAVEGLSWDTGKTFGLNEDKLGFIVCSPDLRDRLAHRLKILQFDVSRRLKVLFREILRRAKSDGYPNYLSERARANVEIAEAVLVGTGLQPLIPDAGSFLLLDTVGHRASASALAAALLQTKSLGVIRIDSFFTPQPPALHADRYIRLAMAREPSVIEEAARRIAYIAR
ncbi:aminotransferase class I/II-fold pyridoxal phosphate-dependent enzyme [Microbacterium sp. PRF11]|uniref:aminotransferase class I/II-fold pyridoxal phosphate-dependent enzyme n=1 Tax=Microbacterium sp. PRF11 TaxID=2962593 RepID=UPI002880F29F|nr:aminotransferase class I/II-fold pyridoxal phosphate-dependent enzyme [Microbacterium sp. PRF11]MDT0115914.1 aminotransferase class I/II-fold pyridoxal phosphate-dependent enzyme [Microbacterium sp. PRF11]